MRAFWILDETMHNVNHRSKSHIAYNTMQQMVQKTVGHELVSVLMVHSDILEYHHLLNDRAMEFPAA